MGSLSPRINPSPPSKATGRAQHPPRTRQTPPPPRPPRKIVHCGNGHLGRLRVVDAYGVHEGVYLGKRNQIFAACCNCHARRKFVEAKPNDPVAAARALAMYRGLYDVEDHAKQFSAHERRELRQRESAPLINQLHDWLIEKSSDRRVLPKSSLGKAVRYSLNQWDELTVFLGDGAIPLDNNQTESELRSLTIGRQNWLFVGSK